MGYRARQTSFFAPWKRGTRYGNVMILLLLSSIAFGGELHIDAKVPVEVYIDSQPVAQLYYPARLEIPRGAGPTQFTFMVNGAARKLTLDVPEKEVLQIIVGRNGITHSKMSHNETPAQPREVAFRATGRESVRIRLAGELRMVNPGEELILELAPGAHPFELRNARGTLIWARGMLNISGQSNVVVQMSEGRMPEVIGAGSRFQASGQ